MRAIDADQFEALALTVPDGYDPESYMEGAVEVLRRIDATPTLQINKEDNL